ncbi:MAG: DUF6155 family protein [Bacteroidota bacterium]
MAKQKLSDLKKYLVTLDEEALREEVLKLFSKFSQVQAHYAQEFMSETERKNNLDAYKKKIRGQFWTSTGNRRKKINYREIRRLLSEFENVSLFPYELTDLILYRVEVATEYASLMRGMTEVGYNAAHKSFEKALALMDEHKFGDYFQVRCEALFKFKYLDGWYVSLLKEAFKRYFV